MSVAASFSDRLGEALAARRHLCVGIDPHRGLLADWGLADDAAGAERMGREVVAAAAGVAACVKPQIAFFERFGSAGYAALERVLADARGAGVPVIADVKRGDIGTSFAAYAEAWLAPGSPLEADAMTVAAYQGFGSLAGACELVREHGKGLFVLAATSNPEAREVQRAQRSDGRSVARAMVDDALACVSPRDTHVSSVGVVLGATLRLEDFGIDTGLPPARPALPVLAPGFGHQGARIEDAREIFGGLGWALLANESRSLLGGGAEGLATRIRERSELVGEALASP
ncbi:orotidine-5'-phosphate decarboxylase [Leucobacter massiliensis]|uniref:Orotidine-5'-phosphate decarboxylase n=1 Tax=Leucobacter massiliensis TaxID=1686285 RepID=A0A2S9QRJ0_9MICO|nr:orotidine-5'-phosphate decarboxylase [Leucobacter massiliensis]